MKYCGVHLTQHLEDLFGKKHKTLKKWDLNKWRDMLCSWKTQRCQDVCWPLIDTHIWHNSYENLSKIFCRHRCDYSKIYLERHWNGQKCLKKNKVGVATLPDSKACCLPAVLRPGSCQRRERHEVTGQTCGSLLTSTPDWLQPRAEETQWRRSPFQQRVLE